MIYIFSIIFLLYNIILFSQEKDVYQINDSVIIIDKRIVDENINQQKLNLEEIRLTGFINYDLINYLKIIGINSSNDFNTIPFVEGADFNEQQFFINNIPIPFQSRLIGLQSGINSLLFSQIFLMETHSINTFSKPVKIKIKSNDIDTSQIHFKSNINFLHLENVVTFPIEKFDGGIAFGYNRSLLESVRPLLNNSYKKNDLKFKKFPFFQGYQLLSKLVVNNIIINPIFIYSEDNGVTGISSKEFNFNSKQLNLGIDIQAELSNINQSIQLYYNKGKNDVNYVFFETSEGDVNGATNLFFKEIGINSSSKYKIATNHTLDLSFGFKHQNTFSENDVSFNEINKMSSYSSDYFETKIYYNHFFSKKILSSFNIGINSFELKNFNPSFGIDVYYFDSKLFDARFQLNYEQFQEPINPIYFSFQNTIWDPSSTNSLFFVDDKNLPIKPIRCLNTSINVRKQINNPFMEINLSIKFFLRQLKNLIYANSYPDEVTIYNSDLEFNQHFDGLRYGLSFLLENKINAFPLKNITSINLFQSINYDNKNYYAFYSLNYSPITFTNFIQYRNNNFSINLLFFYNSGKYFFNKNINTYYSTVDSINNYSISTDYNSQFQLKPYFRTDISFLYKIYQGNFNLNIGLSFLNIFNNKNESKKNFSLDLLNKRIVDKSEYFNLPRFLVLELNMSLTL